MEFKTAFSYKSEFQKESQLAKTGLAPLIRLCNKAAEWSDLLCKQIVFNFT